MLFILLQGLINELNALLEPVRQHFTTNERAKELLANVQQFKKEALASIGGGEFRRLDLPSISNGNLPANCHLVFAPLPTATPSLQLAMNTVAQIRSRPNTDNNTKPVLLLSDWSARVQNACGAEEKAIQSFYDVFICSLRALDAQSMENVVIVKQSDAILMDPSNYWISAINVGRRFMLDEVMGEKMKDSDAVGRIIVSTCDLVRDFATRKTISQHSLGDGITFIECSHF